MKLNLRQLFGKNIKELRLTSGVSQEAFADKCGFARSYMSRIERGVANPSLDAIETLALGLGVEASAFFKMPAITAPVKRDKPIEVPFASDGTCFNPTLKLKRSGKFTVGAKGHLVQLGDFESALQYLKDMDVAHWKRPNTVGNGGIVKACRWAALPRKYLKL